MAKRVNYKERYKRLKKLHNFSFDLRQKMTPQRKSAITKAWNRYDDYIRKVESGEYDIIPATRSQRKKLKEQYPVSNSKVIINKPMRPGVKRKPRIIGAGKNSRIVNEVKLENAAPGIPDKKIVMYAPFGDNYNPKELAEKIGQLDSMIKPDFISVAMRGHQGARELTAADMAKYGERLLYALAQKGAADAGAFTGLYLTFYNRLDTEWEAKIHESIKSVF